MSSDEASLHLQLVTPYEVLAPDPGKRPTPQILPAQLRARHINQRLDLTSRRRGLTAEPLTQIQEHLEDLPHTSRDSYDTRDRFSVFPDAEQTAGAQYADPIWERRFRDGHFHRLDSQPLRSTSLSQSQSQSQPPAPGLFSGTEDTGAEDTGAEDRGAELRRPERGRRLLNEGRGGSRQKSQQTLRAEKRRDSRKDAVADPLTKVRRPACIQRVPVLWRGLRLSNLRTVKCVACVTEYNLQALYTALVEQGHQCRFVADKTAIWFESQDPIGREELTGRSSADMREPSDAAEPFEPPKSRWTRSRSADAPPPSAHAWFTVGLHTDHLKQKLQYCVHASGALIIWGLKPQMHCRHKQNQVYPQPPGTYSPFSLSESAHSQTAQSPSPYHRQAAGAGGARPPPRASAAVASYMQRSCSPGSTPLHSLTRVAKDDLAVALKPPAHRRQPEADLREMERIVLANAAWNNDVVASTTWFLSQFADDHLRPDWICEDVLHYTIGLPRRNGRVNKSVARISHDHFYLKSDDPKEQVAASMALAQSTVLGVFEEAIVATIRGLSHMPWEELACPTTDSESWWERLKQFPGQLWTSPVPQTEGLVQKIAELYVKIIDINLVQKILDVPEYFWEDPTFQPTWARIHSYMEVHSRVQSLNHKCGWLKEFLEDMTKTRQDSQETRMTWICIIWLGIYVISYIAEAFLGEPA